MTYLITIFICSVIIYIPNAFANLANSSNPWLHYFLAVVIFITASVIVDGIVAFLIRRLPERIINHDKGIIHTYPWEEKLFKKIGVKKWKKFMPDLGMFTNFQKGKIENPMDNEYISRYILEASYGVLIHYFSVITAPLILLLGLIRPSDPTVWSVGIPVMFVNMVLILLPALSLKCNIPVLVRIYRLNQRKVAKESKLLK